MTDSQMFGSKMKVTFTAASSIIFPLEAFISELEFYQPKEEHKPKFTRRIKFNYPSNVLHITNISPRIDENFIYQLISKIHEPIAIYKLFKRENKSEMFLIEFESAIQSFEVLAILNHKKIDNRSIKLSFSHPDLS